MTNGRFFLTLLVILMGVVPGCDQGMGPITEETGFSGIIFYKNWPMYWEDRLLARVPLLRLAGFQWNGR